MLSPHPKLVSGTARFDVKLSFLRHANLVDIPQYCSIIGVQGHTITFIAEAHYPKQSPVILV
jgi:hypothetical protein